MNRNFAAVQSAVLADPSMRNRVRLLSISLDPDYDTPSVLAEHAKRAGAHPGVWTFLTGTRRSIDRFALQFGVYVVRDDKTPGNITHNLRTALIDPQGALIRIFTGSEWSPSVLIAALSSGR
jgi:protein SCO1/2